jgi:signal transduction histidine kinase
MSEVRMRMTRTRVPWFVLAGAGVLFAIAFPLGLLNGSIQRDAFFASVAIVIMIGYATVGALIASRRAGGPIGWLFMVVGLSFLLSVVTSEYAIYAYRHPGALPLGVFAAWASNWLFIPSITPLIVALALFPTGRVLSSRWRFLPVAIAVLSVFALAGTMLRTGQLDVAESLHIPNPTGVDALQGLAGALSTIAGYGLIASLIAALVAIALRFRRSRDEERQQIRWLAYAALGGGLLFITALLASLVTRSDSNVVVNALFYGFFLCMGLGVPFAAGVAILRYRLWDLDLVVRKAVIFALVTGAITIVLLVLAWVIPVAVVGIGTSGWERGLFLVGILLGTMIGPLRRGARRIADRLVYGGRATPYEVLTEFSGRLADTYAADDVVPRMAAIVGSGTGARRVTIWLRVGRDLRPVASWPEPSDVTEEDGNWFEVRNQGAALGAITVSMPANDPMTPDRERLVHDLAAQAGLVLRNVRLIEELRESRRRIVAAQDTRARALERDIHDGAQQQLVALAVKLRLADSTIDRDPAAAHAALAQLQADAQDALETLRDLARGIYPPLLADKGLPAALAAQATKSAISTRVTAGGVGRYPQEIETAVYFCALEALQNASKYSRASSIEIRLEALDGELAFGIRDDGVGFDTATVARGVGLEGMADRIDAIGGRLSIESEPGRGTRIAGSIRLSASSPTAGTAEGAAREGNGQPATSGEPVAAAQADSRRSGPNTAFGM